MKNFRYQAYQLWEIILEAVVTVFPVTLILVGILDVSMGIWYFACIFFCGILVETKATSVQGSFGGTCSLAVIQVTQNNQDNQDNQDTHLFSLSHWNIVGKAYILKGLLLSEIPPIDLRCENMFPSLSWYSKGPSAGKGYLSGTFTLIMNKRSSRSASVKHTHWK